MAFGCTRRLIASRDFSAAVGILIVQMHCVAQGGAIVHLCRVPCARRPTVLEVDLRRVESLADKTIGGALSSLERSIPRRRLQHRISNPSTASDAFKVGRTGRFLSHTRRPCTILVNDPGMLFFNNGQVESIDEFASSTFFPRHLPIAELLRLYN